MVSLQASGVCIFLICITTVVQSQVYQIKPQEPGKIRIDNVVDGDLRNALNSIKTYWNVESLDLSGNVLSNIHGQAFARFANLKELNLASNVITGEVDVSSLARLETLDVSNNYISRVKVGSSLKNLHATSNNITSVYCDSSRAVKRFVLTSNKINNLVDLSPGCRQNLEELNLELNDIDVIDFAVLGESRATLVTLNLGLNFIYDVKASVNVVFQKLGKLDLQNNKIAFMSGALNAANNAEINLRNNKLVLIDDKLNIQAHKIDCTKNEFQCQTLQKYLTRTKSVPSRLDENCEKNVKGICCEDLSAPFADRLIALKRREHSLFTPSNAAEDQQQCEQENKVRSERLAAILKKYKTQVDEGVRQRQEQSTLNVQKAELENKLKEKEEIINNLKKLLEEEANSLHLPLKEDTVQMIDAIVQYYEERYNKEQDKQKNAIRDLESYQKMIEQQLEEKERLEKLNLDADNALQKANATLIELTNKQAALTKTLHENTEKKP